VLEVGQYHERLFPCGAGLREVPGGVLGVAEVTKRLGRTPAAAELTVQVKCAPVAGSGLGEIAELLVGVPEAVQHVGHALLIAEVAKHGERLLTVAERLLVIAEYDMEPAD
jgi:hypothetical protein